MQFYLRKIVDLSLERLRYHSYQLWSDLAMDGCRQHAFPNAHINHVHNRAANGNANGYKRG